MHIATVGFMIQTVRSGFEPTPRSLFNPHPLRVFKRCSRRLIDLPIGLSNLRTLRMASPLEFYRNFQALMRQHGIRHVLTSGMACVEYGNFNTPDDLSLWPAELDGGVERP